MHLEVLVQQFVKNFIDKNFTLVLTSSSDEKIRKLKKKYGDKHFYYKIDLSDSENLQNCLDEISKIIKIFLLL